MRREKHRHLPPAFMALLGLFVISSVVLVTRNAAALVFAPICDETGASAIGEQPIVNGAVVEVSSLPCNVELPEIFRERAAPGEEPGGAPPRAAPERAAHLGLIVLFTLSLAARSGVLLPVLPQAQADRPGFCRLVYRPPRSARVGFARPPVAN